MHMQKTMHSLAGALLAVTVSLVCVSIGLAQSTTNIEISKNWLRATPPSAKAGGGFMVVTNNGDEDDRLKAIRFDGAKRTEIHTMTMNNGVMEMRKLDNGILIAAGESATLQPGANHLMLMGLKAPLAKGESHKITLVFEKAGEIPVGFPVLSFPDGKKLMKQEN